MINLLIIMFAMTLSYIAVANRYVTYIRTLGLQGLLLFGVAMIELHEINPLNLVFILLETLVFKAIFIPLMLQNIVQKNKIKQDCILKESNFNSIFFVLVMIMFSFIMAFELHDEHLQITYFTASVSALLTGLYLIVFRKTIVTHVVGYLVLENGIFLFSLALGSEMPMIVNTSILLDLFTSVLILSIFVNRISEVFHSVEIDSLTELKD